MLMKNLKKYMQKMLRRMGYRVALVKLETELGLSDSGKPYVEREEYGASNLQTKLDNVKSGLPFEYPDIVNLNNAVILLVQNEKRIVELGSGTGKFAYNAAKDQTRNVVASEFDFPTYKWCLDNIPKLDNLRFLNGPVSSELATFDLSVSIEVVEHIGDYVGFLKEMCSLAPRSLITTPNRKRSEADYHAGPPAYFKHVREWTAGEFYWVLRCFWNDVRLYALTSQTEPQLVEVNVDTVLSPLIADCRSPLMRQ